MSKDKLTKNVILYLIKGLGKKIEGKKKLMKLMFLIEHYDFNNNKLTTEGRLNNNFCIYYYGVFSFNIMKYVNELIEKGIIKDEFPLKIKKDVIIRNLNDAKELVDNVIEKFGDELGYSLEKRTLKMLGIEPYEKKSFFEKNIKDILKKRKAVL